MVLRWWSELGRRLMAAKKHPNNWRPHLFLPNISVSVSSWDSRCFLLDIGPSHKLPSIFVEIQDRVLEAQGRDLMKRVLSEEETCHGK